MATPRDEHQAMLAEQFSRQNSDIDSSTMLTSGEERSLGNIFQILNQVNLNF